MKTDDVPQDEGSCYGDVRRLTYAVDEEGRYAGVPTKGWRAEIDATNVAIEQANLAIRAAWERARQGRASPLLYHMAVARMEVGNLASDAGVWRWTVRRHLRPGGLARAAEAVLGRYAEAMGLSVDTLRTLPPAPEVL